MTVDSVEPESTSGCSRTAPAGAYASADQRIQKIIATAAELFGERGYDVVSLEDVAERLDVTKGSLYYYFRQQGGAGHRGHRDARREWTARLERLPGAQGGPAGSAAAGVDPRAHRRSPSASTPRPFASSSSRGNWPEEQQARIKALRRRHDQLFRAVIEEGVARRRLRGHERGHRAAVHARSDVPGLRLVRRAWQGAALEQAIDELTDTLMMLVGVFPAPGRGRDASEFMISAT